METERSSESMVIWRANQELDPSDITRLSNEMEMCVDIETGEGTIKSSYFIEDIYKRPEIFLLEFYSEVTKKMVDDISYGNSHTGFNYWCQMYDGSHEPHDHFDATTLISFVHFVRPVGKYFYFIGPGGEKLYPRQEDGDVIAFPSWAAHGIDASYGKERITIAGNINFNKVITVSGSVHDVHQVRENLFIIEKT